MAILYRQTSIAAFMLECGADVHAFTAHHDHHDQNVEWWNSSGLTFLELCVRSNAPAIAALLRARGASY